MCDDPRSIGGVRGRFVLLATVTLTFVGCAEPEIPQVAPYGVAESAVSSAKIQFTSPTGGVAITSSEPVDVEVTVEVTGFTLGADGQIRWFVDATQVGESVGPAFTFEEVPLGVHRLGAWLVDTDGALLAGPGVRASVLVQVSNPCVTTDECSAAHACYVTQCLFGVDDKVCKYAPAGGGGCCQSDLDCAWSTFCSTSGPLANTCVTCAEDADCPDGDPCTTKSCTPSGACSYVKDPTCCITDGDCDDGVWCTVDICDASTNTCAHPIKSGACCKDADCPPLPCTAKTACELGKCTYDPTDGCCTEDGECDDGAPCTLDICEAGQCAHKMDPLCPTLCLTAADCPDDGDSCTVPFCESWSCGFWVWCEPVIVYKEPFLLQVGQGLAELGFKVTELGQTPQVNHWSVVKVPAGQPGVGNVLRFNGGNGVTDLDLESCVTTPAITLMAPTHQMGWKSWFSYQMGAAPVELRVEVGKKDAWDSVKVLWAATATSNLSAAAHQVELKNLSATLGGSKAQLRFCVKTSNTYGVWSWSIDDVFVVPGGSAAFMTEVLPQVVTAGQTKAVIIKAKDPDNDPLSFDVSGPSWISKGKVTFSAQDGSWAVALVVAPDTSAAGVWPVTVRVSDGNLSVAQTFDVVVKHEGGVLIWSPTGATPGAGAIKGALAKMGKAAQLQPSLAVYPDLGPFDAVFVSLGRWPDVSTLTAGQAAKLAAYLEGGGRVYLEGDVFSLGLPAILQPWFPLVATPGTGPVSGLAGAGPLEGEAWSYTESPVLNGLVDALEAEGGCVTVLRGAGADPFGVAVACDAPGGGRSIASSVLFAGVEAGAQSPGSLLASWLSFFETGAMK